MDGCDPSRPAPALRAGIRCPFQLCRAGGGVARDTAPPPPGATGTDLLIKRWSARAGSYELFGALRQAWVRHAGDGHVLVCRPRADLWLQAAEMPDAGELAFTGLCETLRPDGFETLRRLTSDELVCRWSLGIPELGRVEAAFSVRTIQTVLRAERRPPLHLEFSLSGPLKLRPG